MIKCMFLFLLFATCISSSAINILFKTPDGLPVSDVKCTGYSSANDSIASFTSDNGGLIRFSPGDIAYIHASHPDFSGKVFLLSNLKNETDTIVLANAVNLQAVEVTPEDMTDFTTHTTYRLSQAAMQHYPNVMMSLNEIPNMTVLSNGATFYEGDQNIKILIDGIESTPQEIQALSKEDISKVEVYQTPPPRFLAQGVASVIDIKLKSRIFGGNGSIGLSQAFQSLKGNNSAALFYNYKQSRLSLLYNNENIHYRRYRQSEILDYEYDGKEYKKIKEGLNSDRHLDQNDINMSYQINNPADFLYSLKSGFAINRNGLSALQNVNSNGDKFLASNYLHTGFSRFNVGNYFEKKIKG